MAQVGIFVNSKLKIFGTNRIGGRKADPFREEDKGLGKNPGNRGGGIQGGAG
jgi:hypothetical protein